MTTPDDAEPQWTDYWHLAGFEHLYLEDSYVLAILDDADGLSFKMELVLTEQHPEFRPPRSGERYCYRRGTIRFARVAHVIEFRRQAVMSQDATGELDLGNIDIFEGRNGRYRLEGDWGRLEIEGPAPVVTLN